MEDSSMPRLEATNRKMPATRPEPVFDDSEAYGVEEFCRRHRLSVQIFYKYPELMPDSFYVGARRLISREAAARWRAEREAAMNVHAAPRKAI
jgi:hypothetical protein